MRKVFTLVILIAAIVGCNPQVPQTEPPSTLELMLYMERFSDKMFFAAQAENWELADVYAHEMEELAEELEEGGYVAHDIPLADLAGTFGPAVDAVADAIDDENYERFLAGYTALTATCNACHAAVGYEPVRIIVPESSDHPYPGQQFTP